MKLKDYRAQLGNSKDYAAAKKELKLHFALADAVLEARMNKGWTQEELARAIGTKQANISRIESGLANPTLEFIGRLSSVLDLAIDFSSEKEADYQFANEPQYETSQVVYTGVAEQVSRRD